MIIFIIVYITFHNINYILHKKLDKYFGINLFITCSSYLLFCINHFILKFREELTLPKNFFLLLSNNHLDKHDFIIVFNFYNSILKFNGLIRYNLN